MPDDQPDHERIIERGAERWAVREVSARSVPGAHGLRCLICESDSVVRRIWEYPENWEALSDDALFAVCDRSAPP